MVQVGEIEKQLQVQYSVWSSACRAECTYIARQFSLIRNKQKQETLFPLFRSTQQQQYVINQSILQKTNEFCYILWYSNATHFKVINIGPCCLWMLTLVTKGSEYLHQLAWKCIHSLKYITENGKGQILFYVAKDFYLA